MVPTEEGGVMITKAKYVARLEKMLKVKRPCATCPAIEGFKSYDTCSDASYSIDWVDKFGHLDDGICEMCMDFVDAKRTCPCKELTGQVAIRRARQAIKDYRAGKHKWCKEPPKRSDPINRK
jgi:hypothetical protein